MLAEKALLVHVSITQWTGRKLDRNATDTVAKEHATNKQAGNYTKKLLPGSEELSRVYLLASHIRKYFYEETLPWFSDGARVIKSESYIQFVRKFGEMKAEFDTAVDKFISVYPYLQEDARNSLGSLYNTEDYPNVSRLKRKFDCDVHVMPLPDVGDFRTAISDAEKDKFVRTMAKVQEDAMQDCWTRLHEVVQKAAEKLAEPKGIFRDSLLENVTEICKLLPRLNITDDPKLEAKRTEVENLINALDTQKLRKNVDDRQDAASKLAEITKSMGAFMGESK